MNVFISHPFENDGKKVAKIQKEIQELSSEAEIALNEYFAYILSISTRKFSPLAGSSHTSLISK